MEEFDEALAEALKEEAGVTFDIRTASFMLRDGTLVGWGHMDEYGEHAELVGQIVYGPDHSGDFEDVDIFGYETGVVRVISGSSYTSFEAWRTPSDAQIETMLDAFWTGRAHAESFELEYAIKPAEGESSATWQWDFIRYQDDEPSKKKILAFFRKHAPKCKCLTGVEPCCDTKMTRVCAWCGKVMGTKPGLGRGGHTHGICEACLEKQLKE